MKEKGIKEIIMILKKYIKVILVITLTFTLATVIYTLKIVKNKYIASGTIMIQVESNDGSTNTAESQRLVQSTVDILTKMDLIPYEAAKILDNNGYVQSANQIKSSMVVSSSRDSLIITISYISEEFTLTSLVVESIIDALIKVTNDERYNMDKTLKNNISKLYISDAEYYSPNRVLQIFTGSFFGFLLSLILVFGYEVINSGYKEKDEIEEELNIQVLGVIPNFEIKRGNE